ncbi:hypothetical protein [Rickettsia hoogstraalii]|nr:hypothetical protein [Rickettsia hoogstraalii]
MSLFFCELCHCEEKLKILTKQSRAKVLRLPRSLRLLAMTNL